MHWKSCGVCSGFPPLFCLELESVSYNVESPEQLRHDFSIRRLHLLYREHVCFVSLFIEVRAIYIDLFTPIFYLKKETRHFDSRPFNLFGRISV